MTRIHRLRPDSDVTDHSLAADVLLRQDPDEEEGEERNTTAKKMATMVTTTKTATNVGPAHHNAHVRSPEVPEHRPHHDLPAEADQKTSTSERGFIMVISSRRLRLFE
jgi:hypothetical protein